MPAGVERQGGFRRRPEVIGMQSEVPCDTGHCATPAWMGRVGDFSVVWLSHGKRCPPPEQLMWTGERGMPTELWNRTLVVNKLAYKLDTTPALCLGGL